MSLLKIANGKVYDPANGIDGVVQDVWIENGIVVAAPEGDRRPERSIDATGTIIMPGGVDMHCHIRWP